MSLKRFVALLLLSMSLLLAVSANAQEDNTSTLTYEGITLNYDRIMGDSIAIIHYPGDPAESAAPGFSDAAHIAFNMFNTYAVPESAFGGGGGVSVYRMSDLAAYNFLMAQVDALTILLAEKPDIAQGDSPVTSGMENALPFVPMLPHGQIIHARAEYIETEAVQGIGYITYSNADMSPFLSSTFTYTFQGITRDGQFYVAAGFPLETALFPEETPADFSMESFQAEWPQYIADSIAVLDSAAAEDFTPSLSTIRSMIEGLEISG